MSKQTRRHVCTLYLAIALMALGVSLLSWQFYAVLIPLHLLMRGGAGDGARGPKKKELTMPRKLAKYQPHGWLKK